MIETLLKGKIVRKVASQREGEGWKWCVVLSIPEYTGEMTVYLTEEKFQQVDPGKEYKLILAP